MLSKEKQNYLIELIKNGISIPEDFKEDLVRHRRNLHRIPEIGLKLPKTIEYIKKELDSSGIKYRETKTVDGVYGLIEGKNRGKINFYKRLLGRKFSKRFSRN